MSLRDLDGTTAEPSTSDSTDVPIHALREELSVRVDGVDHDHVAVLAEVEEELPPIVVHRQTMRVVDGLHRLGAARLQGRDRVRAVFVDGTEVDALVLAVRLNSRSGLPLTRHDRRVAVARLVRARPEWSDRRIAAVAGVAHRTVGSVRRSIQEVPEPTATVGLDGRVRPRDRAAGRRRAAELLEQRPATSVREVARSTGLSPATVLEVRQRRAARLQVTRTATAARPATAAAEASDPDGALDVLRADPSMRYTIAGRTLLRMLFATLGVRDPEALAAGVPAHHRAVLAQLALDSAGRWMRIADELTTSEGLVTGS